MAPIKTTDDDDEDNASAGCAVSGSSGMGSSSVVRCEGLSSLLRSSLSIPIDKRTALLAGKPGALDGNGRFRLSLIMCVRVRLCLSLGRNEKARIHGESFSLFWESMQQGNSEHRVQQLTRSFKKIV